MRPCLPWRDIETDGVLVVNHHPRRAQISPAFFRIVGNIDAAGADVPSAIQLEPARRRESQKIDVFAAANILQHGPVMNHALAEYALRALDRLRHSETNPSALRSCGMPRLKPSRLVEPSELTRTR